MASAMSRATPITVNKPARPGLRLCVVDFERDFSKRSLHEQRSERGREDNNPTAWRRVVRRDDVRMTVYDKSEAPDIP
jgi:hypothetical protein